MDALELTLGIILMVLAAIVVVLVLIQSGKEKSTVTGYTLYSNLVIAGNSSSNGNSGAIG